MGMLKPRQDAFGAAIWAAVNGDGGEMVIERDDGFVAVDYATKYYFREARDWWSHEREALSLARGRVLDVGVGGGRVARHLQNLGLEVVGIDNSPLALKVCRKLGLKDARLVPIAEASRKRLGIFDTIVMCGNNFGLFGSFAGARRMLRRFYDMTSLPGRIIAQSNDVYKTDNQSHLAYHRRNLRRGRMSGQLRLRVRYLGTCSPYIDYLMVSAEEMRRIVEGTGWRITRVFESPGSLYMAVLEKEPRHEE